jgi:hypothetical protein
VRSRNHGCRGKAISITYSECVVCLLHYLSSVQSACALLYVHLLPVWLHHILQYYLINDMNFQKEGKKKERKYVTEHKMCVLILFKTFI